MKRAAIIVWEVLSRRSRDLALALGIKLLMFKCSYRYHRCLRECWTYLNSERFDRLIVQVPPRAPLLSSLTYRNLHDKGEVKVFADTHSAAVNPVRPREYILNPPTWELLKRSDVVITHNKAAKEYLVARAKLQADKTVVVYDPLPNVTKLMMPAIESLGNSDYFLLPVSWSYDEPIDYVVTEFIGFLRKCGGYKLVITGDYTKNIKLLRKLIKHVNNKYYKNVIFTGFVEDAEYYWLVKNCAALIALTKREYTMQSTIWEAAYFNKPIISPKTNALTEVLGEYALYYDPPRRGDLLRCLENFVKNEGYYKELGIKCASRLRYLSGKSIERLKALLAKT